MEDCRQEQRNIPTTTATTTVQLVPPQKHGKVLEKAGVKDQICQRATDSHHWEGIRVIWTTKATDCVTESRYEFRLGLYCELLIILCKKINTVFKKTISLVSYELSSNCMLS